MLFGTQLGGGTDINRALAYCQSLITSPANTLLVLISDLYEGGVREDLLRRVRAWSAPGCRWWRCWRCPTRARPSYDRDNAAALAELGVPAFACTPDLFPELMAAAMRRDDLRQWVAVNAAS